MTTQNEYRAHLNYNPEELPRELKKFFISATEQEIKDMMKAIGISSFEELFSHVPQDIMFENAPDLGQELEYNALIEHMEVLAKKNVPKLSFIGDGLKHYKTPKLIDEVCQIRGLTTAYTPYQPERSQGTLHTLWLYSSALSMITGFEAINASLYERSTCLYEALNTALRLVRNTDTVLVCESIYPGDIEVIKTLAKETKLNIVTVPINKETGKTDLHKIEEIAKSFTGRIAGIAFPQVNNLGNLEDVNAITDYCWDNKFQSIAIIDPILIATDGLLGPASFGKNKQGCHMIVGEGQHLAIGPNFGGPGLGIFGIRYNKENKLSIRSTAGRYVGKAVDDKGKDALCMVLSTREQHIRREKATSNICSNQSFVASLAGAGILARGESGMREATTKSRANAVYVASKISKINDVELLYPTTSFYNEFVITTQTKAKDLIKKASGYGIHLGVDVSERTGNENAILLSFTDIHDEKHLEKLLNFLTIEFGESSNSVTQKYEIPSELLRTTKVGLPELSEEHLLQFYKQLGELNVSPDDTIYPLGSCTMKYNPYINDYAAGLPGFTEMHPQAPIEDAQGCLEVLYEIQEIFKDMTGLAAVTTQPVAGAQGELVGLKLFQAYHRDNGEEKSRDIILIPRSAHGTNPATATMAGYESKKVGDTVYGIVTIEANNQGQINMDQLNDLIDQFGKRIAGIMVTNPNTSGILEANFKTMADKIHEVGGLVYMDGANMNAIAGWLDLGAMGVDAVHNNLHKTWTIPHGGGGPGDAIVAVSSTIEKYLPGIQVVKSDNGYEVVTPEKSIGSIHRHYGNFAHKVRAYTYLKALGTEGVRKMSAIAVLSAKYLYQQLKDIYPTLPSGAEEIPRMHEFILTLEEETFKRIAEGGTPKAQAIAKVGKLFLDYGIHAPTVAFPEVYGLMIEPTESYSKKELDDFTEVVKSILTLLHEHPEVLTTAPHFTPVGKVDEVSANKNLVLWERIDQLPILPENKISPQKLKNMTTTELCNEIVAAHQASKA